MCETQCPAFADRGTNVFEGDAAVAAWNISLHLIAFLFGPCGIAGLLAVKRSIAEDFRTGKVALLFLR
jgi:hypothetical protein